MRIVSVIVFVLFSMMLLVGLLDWASGCGEVWYDYNGRAHQGECAGTEWFRSHFGV